MSTIASVLRFEGLELDLRRGALRESNGDDIPLRPKSLALLRLFIENAERLLDRDMINKAIWPDVTVTDESITQCVRDVRRALGGNRQHLLKTVPRRGYIFDAKVTNEPPQTPAEATGLMPLAETTDSLEPVAAPRLSIVVLPFVNLSNDPRQDYFTDGITEDVTTDLSRIAQMTVISRNTAFTYKDRTVATRQVGRELRVRYVLEGSIRRLANRIRVNAQLIDVETDSHVWAERFDLEADDPFEIQNDITGRITVSLNLELVGAEAARPTEHPDALDCILRGRAADSKPPSHEKYREAIGWFERALALDPHSFVAQSWLVISFTGRFLDSMAETGASDIHRADVLSGQAIAASPRSPIANYARGQALRVQDRFYDAIPKYETVLSLDRNWVNAYSALAQCRCYAGSIEDAIPLVTQAIRLSPRDPMVGNWYWAIGRVHLLQSRTEEAVFWLERACRANPELPVAHAYLASAYALMGRNELAAIELGEARKLSAFGRYSSIAQLRAAQSWGVAKVRGLFEATYFAGLSKAGVPVD